MIQTVSLTDEGNKIRVDGDFDMSSYTDLILTFTDPDGSTFEKSYLVGTKVTLGTSLVVDEVLGSLEANTYVEYVIETPSPFLSYGAGYPWSVLLTYENTTPTPDIRISGEAPALFKVCAGA